MVSSARETGFAVPVEPQRPRAALIDRIPDWLLLTLVSAGLIGVWQGLEVWLNPPPYIFPSPAALAAALWSAATDPMFWANVSVTAYESAAGFAAAIVVAFVLGFAVTEVRLLERAVLPYIVAMQGVPKIAIAPLIIIWFGFGMGSKVVIAAMLAFFPIFINVLTGFRSVDERQLMLMRSLCATRWQIFFKLRVLTAAPFIFAGLQMAIVFACLGVVVGEFIGSKLGIGSIIIRSQTEMDVANVFVGVTALSILVCSLSALVRVAGKKLIFWTEVNASAEDA